MRQRCNGLPECSAPVAELCLQPSLPRSGYVCQLRANAEAEGGVILALGVFLLLAMFFVLGLTIDAGNLYQAQLQLQKAADSGALGGLGATIIQSEELRPLNDADERTFIETRAQALAWQSLEQDGIDVPLANIIATYRPPSVDAGGNPVNGRLTVNVQAEIPLWLINKVPGEIFGMQTIGDTQGLAAVASAERPPANIVLVLDVSNSMRCLSGEDADNCSCLTPNRVTGQTCEQIALGSNPPVPQRIDRLKEATRDFARRFDTNFDRIAIVPFNIAGSTVMESDGTPTIDNVNYAVRFRPYAGDNVPVQSGFDFDEDPTTDDAVSVSIDSLAPRSNTNLTDALLRAHQEADRVGLFGVEPVLYLVFSDGAPTAGRFLFTENAVGGRPLPHRARAGWLGDFDYTVYSIYWDPVIPDIPQIPAAVRDLVYAGPSPLIYTGDIKINESRVTPDPNWVPPCSEAELQALSFRTVFNQCISSFESKTPDRGGSGKAFGSQYLVTNFFELTGEVTVQKIINMVETLNSVGLRFWREMFFNTALETADFLRNNRGTVYSIGLGQETIPQNDAYQFAENMLSGVPELQKSSLERKDVALSRLANSYTHAYTDQQMRGLPAYPDFPYLEHDSYSDLRDSPGGVNEGLYFPTVASAQLEQVFERAALDALLRLIQ